jgi:hypothetical protein
MRLSLLAALVVSLGGCSAFGDEGPRYTGPDDYAYTLTVTCYCILPGPLRVTVRDGEVAGAERLAETDLPDAEGEGTTLADLTALARRALREADRVDVTYDPTYGYPTDLYIDWDEGIADEEVGYTVTDFEAL